MYRGSSFLLQHTYTVHLGAVQVLANARFASLWKTEFGANESNAELVPLILEAIDTIREAYRPFASSNRARLASETLVTKILLGTFGCLPACDLFFRNGFRSAGLSYSRVNAPFIRRILAFSQRHLRVLRDEQARIEHNRGKQYPLMKLIDMYFWEIGYEESMTREK